MTTFDRIEPRLPELIDELSSARVPDYFDDLLQATAQAPQRPAWSALERWLPMGEIARPILRSAVPWRPIIVFALLTMLALGGLLMYAGSGPRLPAPFGRAANGVHSHDRRPTGPEQLQTTHAECQKRLDRALAHASDDPVNLDRRHEVTSGTFNDRRQRHRYDQAQPSEVRQSPSGPAR